MVVKSEQPVMIYHVPFVLNSDRKSGSALRPQRMFEAFAELGYRIMAIEGSSTERKRKFELVRRYVNSGGRIEFCYSESSTMPQGLTDSDHLPRHPLVDYAFYRWCSENGIPLGLFYRDIFWKYPEYLTKVPPVLGRVLRGFYKADLLSYDKYADIVFLPSEQMFNEIPILKHPKLSALPPGSNTVDTPVDYSLPVTLFYVGGLGRPIYSLHELFKAVNLVPGVRLICCVLQPQWEANKAEYEPLLGDSVEIVHATGVELEKYYQQAHIASLVVEPGDYWRFASPIKMYEYIGHGKPIMAISGTLTGRKVDDGAIGWTVPYEAEAIAKQLSELAANPDEYAAKLENVYRARPQHTWRARASQVAQELAACDRRGQI
ncbi:hypothetical protein [Boudabousia marimammalium]|uniref:Glycosyl transferase family 1 domain-containing protein n=1 Tax=Boudabousia marimammalium TaxID=156892 RepID=A0A1Q5PS22_9ACTO|nr:hypothetical protein [Boudabousia marimammalium]OKL50232.1 hypothetical protein BM477_02225 [Boudabousia marimammalium]